MSKSRSGWPENVSATDECGELFFLVDKAKGYMLKS